ncbi:MULTISPECIES: helix-turn-helix transcriptional regulator [unclassified Bradyrhizobium]|uniref:helix-turn-helix transcriptional regulator n=1 Tax=unclassified Bradyrhizobium TaxID=2631580 RepID=UPI0028F0A931|nr:MULTISPECIES: helix-turn-helix transcriptional regulator [unclassified Bradyrhizobium]
MSEASAARRSKSANAYGRHLADCFSLPEPPSHVQRTLQRGILAVSELRLDTPTFEPSASLSYDDAFLVSVQLKNINHDFWLNGRAILCDPAIAGMTYIHDLRQDPRALVRDPARTLHFYMPLATLNAFAEQNDRPTISDLIHKPAVGRDDPVMRHLSHVVLTALEEGHDTSGLLLDEILAAACAHTLGQYGSGRIITSRPITGLAPWQERRAKEMMNDHLDVSLAELAEECHLSVTHFARAFRQSTGMPPHQWLLARRISKAKSLLAKSDLTLTEIALACGFYSQSHLNTAFKNSTNLSPGRWRRSVGPLTDVLDE